MLEKPSAEKWIESSPEQIETLEIRSRAALLCPDNDAESHLILKIAEKAGIAVIKSDQERGARLEREENLEEKVRTLNKPELWIVEMPGTQQEMKLVSGGLKVKLIDHHAYEDVNRMEDPITAETKPSSLEQFLALSKVSDEELSSWGFNPRIARGIGIMDARYVKGLREAGYSPDEIEEVLELRRGLIEEFDPEYEKIIVQAEKVWENKKIHGGFLILKSRHGGKMRSAISELSILNEMDTVPMVISTNGGGTITVQNMKPAVIEKLKEKVKTDTYIFGSGTALGILNQNKAYTPEQIAEILQEIMNS